MTVKNLKEAEDRIRRSMLPPQTKERAGFSPGIQNIRQKARKLGPSQPGRQLPTGRG